MFHFRSFDCVRPAQAYPAHARGAVLPGDVIAPQPSARARHAQALAYAGQRRRAAQACRLLSDGVDAIYWKAGAPAALARASNIRTAQGLAPLP